MNKTTKMNNVASYRHKLLVTVSAAALTGLVYGTAAMAGSDENRPLIWLELGGQFDHVGGQPDPYLPDFTAVAIQHGLMSATSFQTPPRYSLGEDAAISFQPENSDWIFSAAIRYGRSSSNKHRHQQVPVPPVHFTSINLYPQGPNHNSPISQTADYGVKTDEHHAILDFQAGKDVGLGMLTGDSKSQLALGVRVTQFTADSNLKLLADPDPHLGSKYVPGIPIGLPILHYYQFYKAKPRIERNFKGLGPSVSWTGSMPLSGTSATDEELAFDWGVNFSLLFGRQKARIHHHTTADLYERSKYRAIYHKHYVSADSTTRSRSVTVPNVGGLAGLSLKFPNAKISIGYRADFFFGAIDGGIDTAKKENRGFFGPFASISIGLGD